MSTCDHLGELDLSRLRSFGLTLLPYELTGLVQEPVRIEGHRSSGAAQGPRTRSSV
jgi:hypothetical protein